MKLKIFIQILAGLIFAASIIGYVNAAPETDSLIHHNQTDDENDYQYSDDEGAPTRHTKSTEPSAISDVIPFFSKANITIKTLAGKNAILDCPVKNLSDHNVVLWYKDGNVLTTGTSVLNEDYTIDTTNFSLKVINVTDANKGEYYCEIQPQNIRLHTTLVLSEGPIEAIIPESSKSSQESVYFKMSTKLITSSVIGIFLFFRI